MQAVLLTMLALAGADLSRASADPYYNAPHEHACSCATQKCGPHGCHASAAEQVAAKRAAQAAEHERRHMMPQTCYAPRYGCYYGGDRHMHRYPAFHGTFYRRPYNYRNLFDYPWHAELHEPTSLYSYNVDSTPGADASLIHEHPPAPPQDARLGSGTRLLVADQPAPTSLSPSDR
jgi:hypothetical protein